jgi:actin-like ATPase involved in cell morphogenesis
MYGRLHNIEVARPLQNGVIADYVVTETLLYVLLDQMSGRCVSSGRGA